jgi:hypothetical protein
MNIRQGINGPHIIEVNVAWVILLPLLFIKKDEFMTPLQKG